MIFNLLGFSAITLLDMMDLAVEVGHAISVILGRVGAVDHSNAVVLYAGIVDRRMSW